MAALYHQFYGRAYRPGYPKLIGDVFCRMAQSNLLRFGLATLLRRHPTGRGGLYGELLAPDACWVWRYVERTFPRGRLFGFGVLEN